MSKRNNASNGSGATQSETNLARAALEYARNDYAVIPCKPGSKTPLTPNGGKDATTKKATIRAWWQKWPDANIGIATGTKSGVWVLDIDGEDGDIAIADLEQKYGNLPDTVEVETPNGWHLWFDLPSKPLVKTIAGKLGTGLDVRGEGGLVIAPPSIHPSGKRYRFVEGMSASERDPERSPKWLTNRVTKKSTAKSTAAGNNGRSATSNSQTSNYGFAALEDEVQAIKEASWGAQEETLNASAFKIGSLVAGGEIRRADAFEALVSAGLKMSNEPYRDTWGQTAIEAKVERALKDGAKKPRSTNRSKSGRKTESPATELLDARLEADDGPSEEEVLDQLASMSIIEFGRAKKELAKKLGIPVSDLTQARNERRRTAAKDKEDEEGENNTFLAPPERKRARPKALGRRLPLQLW